MVCPYCENKDGVPYQAIKNAETYREQCLVVTTCCNKPIEVQPVMDIKIHKYRGKRTTDDWGNEFDGQV